MTRRRLVIDAVIVVGAIGILVLPYLLPERGGPWPSRSHSWAYCTQFQVRQDALVSSSSDGQAAAAQFWTAEITISNAGPHGAELLSGEIVSRFRTGAESWPVSMESRVLRPGATTSITLQLPVTTSDSAAPRVWEFRGHYQTRPSRVYDWLGALPEPLPRQFNLPRVWQNQLAGRYPENYDSVLTNDLGWRFKVVGQVFHGGLHREWRPAVDSATPFKREFVERMVTDHVGKPVILTAVAPMPPSEIGTNKASKMTIIKGEFAFYRGHLDGLTEEGVRIRAPVANESGDFEVVEVQAADILGYHLIWVDADVALGRAMESWLGQHSSSPEL